MHLHPRCAFARELLSTGRVGTFLQHAHGDSPDIEFSRSICDARVFERPKRARHGDRKGEKAKESEEEERDVIH